MIKMWKMEEQNLHLKHSGNFWYSGISSDQSYYAELFTRAHLSTNMYRKKVSRAVEDEQNIRYKLVSLMEPHLNHVSTTI